MSTQTTSPISPAEAVTAGLKDNKTHLLLASSGSVATIKLPLIISAFSSTPNLSIRVILTKSASHFLAGQSAEQPTVASLSSLPNVDGVYHDEDEWAVPWTREASILHIELRRWAHLLAVPLSANTLAKVVNGMADNLLTSVIRCWDISPENPGGQGPRRMLVAPAMNTQMWLHPVTEKQIRVLEEEWGVKGDPERGWYEVLQPQSSKLLACGDRGSGAMLDWNEIVDIIRDRLRIYEEAAAKES
ncbi:phosphopantothenoylcysteine decarboxylase [Coniochaeta sp. 2T2.1]|nr:phosphopantothenoylcysteine decarboxylase [Coniochaeta sp. 2T2.1]